MEQGTEQWKLARCGSLGASEVHDATNKLKGGGYPAAREQLMVRLSIERLTGRPLDNFKPSGAMLQGLEREPWARKYYAEVTKTVVLECGMYEHPELVGTHASPDGLVGDKGLIEIKCPMWKAHYATINGADIEPQYQDQMQWQMVCTGREWCDFASFNPDFPNKLAMRIRRIHRDEKRIEALTKEVIKFLDALAEETAKLREMA